MSLPNESTRAPFVPYTLSLIVHETCCQPRISTHNETATDERDKQASAPER